MNKHVASLSKGLLSVFLILSLVLPSIALPRIASASLGGGETGAGGFESDVGEGPDGKSSAEAAAAAAEAAGQAANDAAAAALSMDAPEGVSVSGSDATPDSDPNNPTVDVDFGNGQTVSGVSPQAAAAMMDAVAAGLAPATNGQTPGFNPSATAEAHATGKAGIDAVVGNVSATLGSPASVAAAESKAAIGLAAAQSAAAAAAKSMNPFGVAPTSHVSFTTLSADEALSVASKHPAMFSPQSLSTSLPAGFTFSPPTPTTNALSPTPIGGKWGANTFSPNNPTIDATSFSLGKTLGAPSMPGFDAPPDNSYAPTKSDDTSKNQYAQYALGMEIGRMATQKSLAESRYSQLSAQTTQPFAPTNQAQMAALASTKAEIDAWSATIDSRVNPTTQNQAVATLSQSKAADLGKMAADMATAVAANDTSKANQLSQAISAATAAYDAQIADAKSSLAAAQKSLDDANIAAQSAVNAALGNPVSVTPSTDVSLSVDESLADQAWGKVFGVAPTQLSPVVAPITTVLSVVPVVGIAQKAALSVTPTPVVNTIVDVTPFTKSIQAYMDDEPISTVLGLAAIDALGLAFGKAVSVGLSVAGATAGKASVSAPSSTAGKAAAAPAAASTAGKTTAGTTGKTVSVSYNPTNNTVTVHAPVTTSAVVEGKMASAAAKAADDVATPAATVAKSADDVAVAPAAVAKSADDAVAPTSPTSGKAPTAANDNVPSNTPANANSLGSKSATTPTAAPAAKSVDNVTSPTPQTANTPANPNALGSKSATTPTSSASPASKSLSTVMALAQALSAPVAPAAISKSLAGIVDDVAKAISRTADDISLTNPTTLSPKSIDDVAVPATSVGTAAKSAASTNATAPVAAPVSVTPTTVQTTPVTQVAAQPTTPAQTTAPTANQTAPATVQANPSTPPAAQTSPTAAQPATTNPVAAAQTFAPADLGKYTVTPAVQATPATEVALGLKSLGEPTTQMTKDAAAAGFTIESPQQAVAIGIAHEVSPQTRDAIVDAYTRDGNFDSLPDSIIAEPAAFINAIVNEAAGKNRSVVQQVAAKKYLSSVTVDKKAYDTMANPKTRAALTELAKQLTNGTIAAERGLDVAAPARTANHFYASYINPSWAKSLIDVVKVGDYTKTVTGLAPKETNPVREGVESFLDRVDQASLFSPQSVASLPAPAQTVLAFADTLSKKTPATLALEIQVAGINRAVQALPKAAEPAVTNPAAQTQAPAQTPATAQNSVITKDSTDAQVQAYWATKNPKGKEANLAKVNPQLMKATAIGTQTFEALNPQYQVEVQGPASGFRGGGKTKNHTAQPDGYGGALDVVIFDTVKNQRLTNFTGAKYQGQVPLSQAMPVYQQWFNEVAIAAYHMDPQLAKTLRHGGYFGGKYAADAMHVDVRGNVIGTTGGTTLGGFTDAQMKTFGISQNNPLKSWDNVKTLADDRYNNPNQSVAPTVATPVQTAPEVTTAVPTSRPDTVPATVSPSTPISPIPAQVVTPSAPTPSTVSGSPTANTNTVAPDSNTLGSPSTPGQGDTAVSPTTNAGVPPDYQSTGGTGPGRGTGLTNAVLSPIYAFFAAIAIGIDALLGSDNDADTKEPTATPTATNPDGGAAGADGSTGTPDGGSAGDGTTAGGGQTPTRSDSGTNPGLDSNSYPLPHKNTNATSTKITNNVLIQVDGNTGELHFSVAGFYHDGNYYDMSDAEDEGDLLEEATAPSIVLDDQRLNILYSDGTYAPVVVDGVWYESPNDPNYVYTVEYYFNGELVAAADNAGVLPQGNPLTNLLGNLFKSSKEYDIGDVDIVTRALIDPNEQVPADEYYVYRVHLKGGGLRSTTVPRYTSYRYMSERFAETGFIGSVMALIAESVEIPPPSKGGVSAVVDTFRKIGLSIVDLFKGSTNDDNPIVTDFGTLTPSDDGEITMSDVRTVTVILDVEAECPFVLGLSRPYLYEIVIAQAAISGATTDQAFRAVRCGGGDKADFVEQIATHFESFDGVGTINRQAMSNIIRFALFKDLDLSALFGEESTETTGTTTAPTVPDNEDAAFTPNLTNEVNFEVKAVGSGGQVVLDWTPATEISIGTGIQLYFRWSGTAYEQCLPFLNDSGDYALKARGSAMTTGNTESESYDVREASTTYRIECGGQRNNEFGVDQRSVKVIIE